VEFTEASGRTAPAAREKERKGIQRGVEKAAGDERTFIRSRTSNWQMGQLRTPCRTRRAVREVTGPLSRMP
jgi:hypothetical protein